MYKNRLAVISPVKPNAMQSGQAHLGQWLLTFPRAQTPSVDQVMGWISSNDPLAQIQLRFHSCDDAVAYATRLGMTYRVEEAPQPSEIRRVRPQKSYSDNFATRRRKAWTH